MGRRLSDVPCGQRLDPSVAVVRRDLICGPPVYGDEDGLDFFRAKLIGRMLTGSAAFSLVLSLNTGEQSPLGTSAKQPKRRAVIVILAA